MALTAAVLFGASAPFAKLLLASASPQLLAGLLYLGLGHLHLLMDYYGSGPNWPICYWWPFARSLEDCWMNPHAWELSSWQNISAAGALLAWTVAIACFQRRTPLELLMPSLDQKLVNWRQLRERET